MRISAGRDFIRDLSLGRRWGGHRALTLRKRPHHGPARQSALNAEAQRNLEAAWPVFRGAIVRQSWAGMIDVTPDSLPVISPVDKIPGLTLASGFSGHGFGTSPAAGQLAADLVTGSKPVLDPSPYRLDRFAS